jgi:glycosyltransferase involved in cell wall biosynthesis
MGTREKTVFDRELSCFWDHTVVQESGRFFIEPVKLRELEIVTSRFERVRLLCRVEDAEEGNRAQAGSVPFPERFTVLTVAAGRLPRGRLSQITEIFAIAPRVLRRVRQADLVYARHQGIPVFQLAALCALLLGKDLIVTIGGSIRKSFLLRRGPGKRPGPANRFKAALFSGLDRLSVKRADLALINGTGLRAELGGRGHVFASHVFGREEIFTRADTCTGAAIRWLYTGTLSLEKGVDTLLEALALARAEDKRHTLTLAGKDPEPPAWLDAMIASCNLTGQVHYRGAVPFGHELLELYRRSDVFVFPSLHEGMPKSPMEALSQSLPVVTTAAGGGEYIRSGENGLVVAENDPHALAVAVKRLASDGALRKRLITAGRKTAARNTCDIHEESVAGIIERAFR